MSFAESLAEFAKKSVGNKDKFVNEESTKTGLIMPFFQLLGYNVFDPDEFMPEYDAGVFGVKDAKADYVIMLDGQPVMVIEAKSCGTVLEDKYCAQLFKYFSTTPARFAILTNGLRYKFYSDVDDKNVMDKDPFLEIDLEKLKPRQPQALEQFCRSNFKPDELFTEAERLKYLSTMRSRLDAERENPSDEFVKFCSDYVYKKKKTQSAIEKFRPVVREAFRSYIDELVNERLSGALNISDVQGPPAGGPTNVGVTVITSKPQIVTTEEEIEAYHIIRALLWDSISDVRRVSYKDTTWYFSIIMDNMPTHWVCRLKLGKSKTLIIPGNGNEPERAETLASIEDLFNFKDALIASAQRYDK